MDCKEMSEIGKNIIGQASDWNFNGDCLILHWMEQISQNLEARGKTTISSLNKLSKDVGRAQISLENTQNSLNALQYSQYVEMRCQDEETSVEPEIETEQKIEENPKHDILNVFLQNNIKMLHNCHDKFNFPEDSDEDETDNVISGEDCIYQPRNPYNERLLPHIFGTKMWKENWHVGLCEEGVQSYSGDEQSDVYSLSSSLSAENESMESHNTENLSQWTSSVSLNQENLTYSNKIDNSLPPSTSMMASAISDVPFPKAVRIPDIKQGNIDERLRNVEPNVNTTTPNSEPVPSTGAIKRKSVQCKTLNLFDDNDFKSLMSEISDKAQSKQDTSPVHTERVASEKPKVDLFASHSSNPPPSVTKTQRSAVVNLFESPTDDFPPPDRFGHSNNKSKVDLFEDLNSDNNKRNYLEDSSIKVPFKIEKKTMISAKSLFDDDDGDEDFLNLFGKKKSNSISKNEQGEKFSKTKPSSTLFFDNNNDENDFIFSKATPAKMDEKIENIPRNAETSNTTDDKPKLVQEKKLLSTKRIFLDDSDDDGNNSDFNQKQTNCGFNTNSKIENISKESFEKVENLAQNTIAAKPESNQSKKPLLSTTIFLDDSDDDENNSIITQKQTNSAFDTNPKNANASTENTEKIESSIPEFVTEEEKAIPEKKVLSTRRIFLDDSDDEENSSIFSQKPRNPVSSAKTEPPPAKQRDVQLSNNLDNDDNIFNKMSTSSSTTDDVIANKSHANNTMPPYMSLQPPEDFEIEREKQSTIAIHRNPLEFENDVDDDDNFLSALTSSKNATKRSIDAGHFDHMTANSTLLPDQNPFASNDSLAPPLTIIPTELKSASSSSVRNANIPKNELPVAQFATLAEESRSLEDKTPLVSKSLVDNLISNSKNETNNASSTLDKKRFESIKSSELKTESIVEEVHLSKNEKVINETTVGSQDGKIDILSAPITVEMGQPIETLKEPKKIEEELIEDFPHTPKVNLTIPSFKPPTYDSYSPLFLDEPPDDDFFQAISGNTSHNATQSNFESDFYEPTNDKINTSNEAKQEGPAVQKSASYNIGLFSEIPPDDDEHNDDFLEPIVSMPDTSTRTTDIFNKISVKEKVEQNYHKINKPKSITPKPPTTKDEPRDIPAKIPVAKLKMPNININVQALLPNIGGKLKISNTESTKENLLPPAEFLSSKPSQSVTLTKEQHLEAGRENILPSLCKNRVRGPPKRRASTRAGRQQSYLKSLENEQKEQQESQRKDSTSIKNPLKRPKNTLPDVQNVHSKPLETTVTLPSLPVSTAKTYQENPPKPTKKIIGSKLFNDFDDNEEDNDDFFSSLIKTKSSKALEPRNTQKSTLFARNSESSDDLFKSASAVEKSTPKETTQPSTPVVPSVPKAHLASKKTDSLFGSDSNDDEDDDLFRALSKPKTSGETSSNVAKEVKEKQKSLFSDSEDDNDLFGSTAVKTSKVDSAKTVAASSSAPVKKNTQPRTAKTKILVPKPSDNPLADLLDS